MNNNKKEEQNKLITLKIKSLIEKIPDCEMKIFPNTRIWDLKQILCNKIGIAVDFFKLNFKDKQLESDNKLTIKDLYVTII